MPFTYSIAYGLIAGICSYILINVTVWLIEKASGGRIRPTNKDDKEPWTYKLEGGFLPPWLNNVTHGRKPWADDPEANAPRYDEDEEDKDDAPTRTGSGQQDALALPKPPKEEVDNQTKV